MEEPRKRPRARSLWTAGILGVVAGAGYAFVDLALACRLPGSEACVWGKAYLPLSLAISIPVVGGMVAAAVYAFIAWRETSKRE